MRIHRQAQTHAQRQIYMIAHTKGPCSTVAE